MSSLFSSDRRNFTRVCKAKGCFNTFVVTIGGRGAEKQHCSNACKQKTYRTNNGGMKWEKLREIENHIQLVNEMRGQLLTKLSQMNVELDTLHFVQGVAYAENWDDAITLLNGIAHANANPSEYEGFTDVQA